jgi:SAM-dependent methyltransferase
MGLLPDTHGLRCLDIGSDNGVISYFLRKRGGDWKSADLDEKAVRSIRELVIDGVFQIDGRRTPFKDNEFDQVVIVDFLEHIEADREFMLELYRVIKGNGQLIINVPHIKNSLLRKMRLAIGQTDEKHGHLRPGYTVDDLKMLCGNEFSISTYHTYSKFFSECIDTTINFCFSFLKGKGNSCSKGVLVTGKDLGKYRKVFLVYTFVYPIVWLISNLDYFLFFASGYMLIAKAEVNKGGGG